VAQTAADRCIDWILRREGGYVNNPADPGGETNYGITWPTLKLASAAGVVPRDTVVARLTREQAISIYRWGYWSRIWGDEIPEAIALCMLDTAVLHGVRWAVVTLQRLLGVDADGIFGAETAEAARRAAPNATVAAMAGRRFEVYRRNNTFMLGWTHRLFRLLQECSRIAAVAELRRPA
jgi:lysozyme family protein